MFLSLVGAGFGGARQERAFSWYRTAAGDEYLRLRRVVTRINRTLRRITRDPELFCDLRIEISDEEYRENIMSVLRATPNRRATKLRVAGLILKLDDVMWSIYIRINYLDLMRDPLPNFEIPYITDEGRLDHNLMRGDRIFLGIR